MGLRKKITLQGDNCAVNKNHGLFASLAVELFLGNVIEVLPGNIKELRMRILECPDIGFTGPSASDNFLKRS